MAARQARSLVQRYALLLTLAAIPLLALLLGLGLQQFQTQREVQLERLDQLAREQRLALDGAFKPLRDHVLTLRYAAQDRLTGAEPADAQPWRELLRPVQAAGPDGVRDGLGLDHLAGDPRIARLGNLMADAALLARAPADEVEIRMALDLFEPMRLAHLVTPYLQWSYYLSARGDFATMFPFAPLPELTAPIRAGSMRELLQTWLTYDVFAGGTPARNPERSPIWTGVYADAAGSGWMVSHIAPVYAGDRFAGTVGTDLRLAALGDFLGQLSWPAGRAWIVNDQGQVLAGQGLDTAHADQVQLLERVLAPGLRAVPTGELLRPAQGLHHENGYWLSAQRVQSAPFTLLYAVSDAELNGLILPAFLPYGLAIGALLLVLLAAQLVLQRGFVRPALALVRQIQAEARGEPATPPVVPPLWRPWVEAVREAFASRRETETRFKAAAESLLDGLAIFDAEDRLVFYNSCYPDHLTTTLRATLALGKRWEDWNREAAALGPVYHPEMGPDYLERRIADRDLPFCEREHRIIDGRWVRVRESRMPEGGRVLLTGDITPRKEAEARLKESEQRFLAAAESMPDGLAILDAEDRFVFYNSRYPEHLVASLRQTLQLGVRFNDWIREGLTRGPVYHPEMGAGFPQHRLAIRRDSRIEHEQRVWDGRWLRIRENRMPDGGRVLLTTDITARKEADEQLRRSEQRFLAAAESLPDGLVIFDAEDRIVFHNSRHPEHLPKALREVLRLGVRFEDWIREGLARGPVYHPDMGPDYVERRLARHAQDRAEQEHKHADGHWVRVRESRMPDGGRVLLTTDITEARRQREALADQTRKLEAVLANIAEGVSILDAEARVVLVNDGFLRLYDLPRALAAPGTPLASFVEHRVRAGSPSIRPADLARVVQERVQELLAQGSITFEEATPDGRTVLVRRERLPDGLLVSTYSDITLLKARERENALLAAAVQQAGDSVEVTGPDYRLTYVNPAFSRLTGWTSEEALGHTPAELLRSDHHDSAFFEAIDRTLRAGGTWHGLMVSRHKAGHLLFQETTISPLRDEDGRPGHYVAVKRDISQRMQAEEALRDSEARYRAVVETQTEFVMRMRPDGSLTFVNDAYCRQVGQRRDELLDPERNDLASIVPEDRARYDAHIASLTPASPTRTIEIRSGRDEGIRWEQWTDTGIFDAEGRLAEIQSVGHDITERKEAELRLVESEARYRAVVETQAEFVLRYSPQGWLTFVNDAYCRHLGVTREQLLDPTFEVPALTTAEGRRYHLDYLARISPEHPTDSVELRRVLADGSERFELWTDTGVFDHQGRLVEVQAVGRDVTLAKRSEAALRENEARYRAVVEGQREFVLRIRPDGTLTFVNDAYCRYRGLPREVLLAGFDDIRHYPPAEQARIHAAWKRITREQPTVTYEVEEPAEDGTLRYEEWSDTGIFSPEGQLIEIQAVGRDVSERRRAEIALKESEARLAAFMDHAPVGMYLKGLDGRYLMVNPEMARVFGCPAEEMLGRDPTEVLAPEEARIVQANDREILETGLPTRHEEFLQDHDAYSWTMVIRFPVRDEAGRIIQIGGFDVDISQQKRALAELEASEQRFRAIADIHPAPMIMIRLHDRRAMFANRAYYSTFELTPDDLGSFDRSRLYGNPAERDAIFAAVAATGSIENYEIDVRTSQGARFPALLTARTMQYDGQPCCVMAFLDLSALKAAETMIARQREALYQSEKLTALGSLLAGVAHELNNPLSVVTGYAEMLRDTAPDAVTRGRAERVHAAAERCARIVKTFLAMARQKPPQRGHVAMPKVIDGALELAGYGLRTTGVEVAQDMAPGLPDVWGDADQLHQVLVNLVVNAQQALTAVALPRRLTVRARATAGEVVVEVEDNGPGMPPEVRKRIFEPFFTTKPQGVGTGVGLSVCHGIITAHGGRIEVDTAPGRGTLFRLAVPAAFGVAAEAEAVAALPAGRGRVLVVDDEREIAELVAETLSRDGFEVEAVSSGRAALARIAEGGIDLVLTDLRMPDTDGATLIEAVKESRPDLISRLILITGDALGAGTNEVVREAGVPVLEKPLDLRVLRQEVRRLLEAEVRTS